MPDEPYLYNFFGRECVWCERMHPLVDRLMHETGLKVVQLEVWHNKDNQKKMLEFADSLRPACGGRLAVPAFYNLRTKNAICGYFEYDALKKWALENPM